MHDALLDRMRARAADPATIHDMARGMSPKPAVAPAATPDAIARAEAALGFALPPLLVRILTEIGDGGFGPGYGLLPLEDLVRPLSDELHRRKVLAITTWGCGICSVIDCSQPEAPVSTWSEEDAHVLDNVTSATLTDAQGDVVMQWQAEPRPIVAAPPPTLRPHRPSLADFLGAWADGKDLWREIEG